MKPAANVDDYLSNTPEPQRRELERIRDIVKQMVPDAVESISYMMPAFKYKGKPLVYYAAFKNHMSIFPTSGPADVFKEKLAGYQTAKGTIKFTLEKPLPEELIKDIVAYRVGQIDTTAK